MMKRYKASRYNIFDGLKNGNYLIYNTLSSCVAIVTSEELKELKEGCFENDSLLREYKQLGFVVDSSEDELRKVIALRNMNNFNMRCAGFQILPTTGCNARCFYCYEQDFVNETMNSEVIDQTIKFIKNYASSLKQLNIAWFGGEPLLRFDIIEYMSQEFIAYCKENHIEYSANMITNAALLDDSIIKKLKMYKVETIQITIDGYGNVHDKRKGYLAEGMGYHTIIGSIKKLINSQIKVLVRLNIDKQNFSSCMDAIDNLKETCGNGKFIWPYIAPLYSDKDTKNCFSKNDLSEVFAESYKKLIDCGYIQSVDGLPMNFTNASCCATMINNFVIAPSGNIYKCEHLLNDENEKVGDVFSGIIFNKAMCNWAEPDAPGECKNCSYLPICQAGCRAALKRGFGYGRCSYIKFINKAVTQAVDYLLENQPEKECI